MRKLTIFLVVILFISASSLALIIFKTARFIVQPANITAMKGSESGLARILKEESYWERYGVSPEGLVLWLDQSDPRSYGNASTWYDLSGKGNHGTQTTADYQSAIVSGSGLAGYARSFDGVNDYVSVGNQSIWDPGAGAITVSVWAKINSWSTNTRGLVTKMTAVGGNTGWGLYHLTYLGTNFIQFAVYDSSHGQDYANITNPAGGWHHIVGIRGNGQIQIYMDGQYVDGRASTRTIASSAYNLYVGRYFSSTSYYFNGLIDDVQIFSRALTTAEIQRLYLADKPRHGGL